MKGGIGTWVILFVICQEVFTYQDLRNTPCRAQRIALKEIPEEEVEWEGEIRLQLQCDPGYDLPLNFNNDSGSDMITCTKDNRWTPDFVPNCNKETFQMAVSTFSANVKSAVCKDNSLPLVALCKRNRKQSNKLCEILEASYPQCEGGSELLIKTLFSINLKWALSNNGKNLKTEMSAFPRLFGLPDETAGLVFQCPIGSTNKRPNRGLTEIYPHSRCLGCPIGHFLDAQKHICFPCQQGFYQDVPMSSTCKLCPQMKNLSPSDAKVAWAEVMKAGRTREYDVMSCPRLFRWPNGTLGIVTHHHDSEFVFDNLLAKRKQDSVRNTIKSNAAPDTVRWCTILGSWPGLLLWAVAALCVSMYFV